MESCVAGYTDQRYVVSLYHAMRLLAANVVLLRWGANIVPQIPWLDFWGHLQAGKERGKERKERDGRISPSPFPK